MSIDANILILVAGAVATFCLLKFLPRFLAGVPFVQPEELHALLQQRGADVLVIDVRSNREFAQSNGHIKGSINMPIQDFTTRLEEVGDDLLAYKDAPVYLVCYTSNRSPHAARFLRKAGLTNIKVIRGGIRKWSALGYPLVGRVNN